MKSIKNYIVAGLISLSLITVSVNATTPTVSGDIGVMNRDVYRGIETSNDVSVFGNIRINDLFIDGLFVTGSANSINDNYGRSQVGVGYEFDIADFNFQFSVNRYFWSDRYIPNDYTEYTGKLNYSLNEMVNLYGEVSHTPDFSGMSLTYSELGFNLNVTEKLLVSAYGSAIRYNDIDDTKYHNSGLRFSYTLFENFDLIGQYSFGGDLPYDINLKDTNSIGFRYRF